MIDLFLKNTVSVVSGTIIGKNTAMLFSGEKIKFFGRTSVFDIGKLAKFTLSNGTYTLMSIDNANQDKMKTVIV